MAWYLNHYHCTDCGTKWDDEWSCCCDDECPNCGSRNWSPTDSDDLTFVVEPNDGHYVVLMSPRSAEHKPEYTDIAVTFSKGAAKTYVSLRQAAYWDD